MGLLNNEPAVEAYDLIPCYEYGIFTPQAKPLTDTQYLSNHLSSPRLLSQSY